MTEKTPFQMLAELEHLSYERGAILPRGNETTQKTWMGLGFRVGDQHLLLELEDVQEVLPSPNYTRVPGTKNWVNGLANIRGNLIPIFDLKSYFGGQHTANFGRSRILVMERGGVFAGLLVDEVFGQKVFLEDQQVDQYEIDSTALGGFVRRAYRQDDKLWMVFDLNKLATAETFLHVAS